MPATPQEPTGHLEIETKLEAGPDFAVPAIATVSGVPVGSRYGDPMVLHLRATYFDTRRLDLVRSKVTLRRREGGIDDGWHLKLPAGIGARKELGVPLSPGDRAGERRADDPAAIPQALTSLVAGLTRGRRLRPVAEFATTRSVRRIHGPDGTPLVEIADDAVTATRLLPDGDGAGFAGSAGGAPQRWREIEVEVLDGTPEQMAAVCRALVTAGAHPSASSSKLARALGVDSDVGAAATSTPAGDRPGRRTDGTEDALAPTAAEVVAAGLRVYRDQLLGADVALRHADPEAEALHDARAAARRIRSVLTVYDPLFLPGSTGAVLRRLRKLGALIGATRDLDVVTDRVLATLDRTADARQHRERVAEHAAARRRHHLDRLRARITARGHLKALRALDALIDTPPWTTLAAGPATAALPPLLTVAWFRLRALAEAALTGPGATTKAHDVRKAAKTVRYATETAAPALGPQIAALAGFTEQVQDILGAHQDAVTTAAAMCADDQSGGSWTLSAELADQLRHSEHREVERTFDEFVDLWAHRPELPD